MLHASEMPFLFQLLSLKESENVAFHWICQSTVKYPPLFTVHMEHTQYINTQFTGGAHITHFQGVLPVAELNQL